MTMPDLPDHLAGLRLGMFVHYPNDIVFVESDMLVILAKPAAGFVVKIEPQRIECVFVCVFGGRVKKVFEGEELATITLCPPAEGYMRWVECRC